MAIGDEYAFAGSTLWDGRRTDQGLVFVFRLAANGIWNEMGYLTPKNPPSTNGDTFGSSVSISGEYVIVGARLANEPLGDSGAAYIYEFNNITETFIQISKLIPPDSDGVAYFGDSVAISGNWAVVGAKFHDLYASDAGIAYVYFRNSSGIWQFYQRIVSTDISATDYFGQSVDMNCF